MVAWVVLFRLILIYFTLPFNTLSLFGLMLRGKILDMLCVKYLYAEIEWEPLIFI